MLYEEAEGRFNAEGESMNKKTEDRLVKESIEEFSKYYFVRNLNEFTKKLVMIALRKGYEEGKKETRK